MRFRVGVLDVAAVVVVLTVVILPPRAWPVDRVYGGEPVAIARQVASLQADLASSPVSGAAAERLADLLAAEGQTDWALRAAGSVAARGASPDRWRALLSVAAAHAERFELKAAEEAASEALGACDAPAASCGANDRLRLATYGAALAAGVASGVDPRVDPKKFDEAVRRAVPTIRLQAPSPGR